MKKLLTICLLIMTTCQVIAQDTTKLTAKYVYEDVKQGFAKLVSTLEGPAKHTYETYVRQQQVEAQGFLIIIILLAIIFVPLIIACWKKSDFEEGNAQAIIILISVGAVLIDMVLLISFFTTSYYSQLVNPEYWAIQDIIKQIKL